jgi:hypothetical protein
MDDLRWVIESFSAVAFILLVLCARLCEAGQARIRKFRIASIWRIEIEEIDQVP